MLNARVVGPVLAVALVPALALADRGYERGYERGYGSRYQYAEVLAAEPIYHRVAYTVPVEQCRQQTVAYREPQARSYTGPILGAIVGGAIGNAVGHKKRNKQVGVAVGAVLGGTIGADIARRNRSYAHDVRYGTEEVCSVVHEEHAEERLEGYDVTYRYGGQTYTTRMDRHPGSTLRVQVSVTPVG